jgi:hypothetical protein
MRTPSTNYSPLFVSNGKVCEVLSRAAPLSPNTQQASSRRHLVEADQCLSATIIATFADFTGDPSGSSNATEGVVALVAAARFPTIAIAL